MSKLLFSNMNAQNMQKLRKWHLSYKITIFSLEASLLDLIFKNIYKVRITYISWIHNFYINLTWFKAWNNRFYPKATKLRKLKMRAMGHGWVVGGGVVCSNWRPWMVVELLVGCLAEREKKRKEKWGSAKGC